MEAVRLGVKKYVNDFQPGKQGYEYTGKKYRLVLERKEWDNLPVCYGIELLLISLLFFLGLTRNNPGSRIFWILLPYICIFLPIAFGWMAVFSLLQIRKKALSGEQKKWKPNIRCSFGKPEFFSSIETEMILRRMDYDKGIRRPLRCGMGMMLLSGAVVVMDAVLVLPGLENAARTDELFFFFVCMGIFVISLVFVLISRKIKKKAENFTE